MITPGVDIRGVLDTSFERVPADAPDRVPTGCGFWCNAWPANPAWRFVAVNIEHEDASCSRIEGLTLATANLRAAAAEMQDGRTTPW